MGKGRINYRRIKESELSVSLFADFDRYQEVNRCWRKEDGEWVLKDIVFNEQWSDSDYRYLTECLIHTIQTGGVVFGAFVEELYAKTVTPSTLQKPVYPMEVSPDKITSPSL